MAYLNTQHLSTHRYSLSTHAGLRYMTRGPSMYGSHPWRSGKAVSPFWLRKKSVLPFAKSDLQEFCVTFDAARFDWLHIATRRKQRRANLITSKTITGHPTVSLEGMVQGDCKGHAPRFELAGFQTKNSSHRHRLCPLGTWNSSCTTTQSPERGQSNEDTSKP